MKFKIILVLIAITCLGNSLQALHELYDAVSAGDKDKVLALLNQQNKPNVNGDNILYIPIHIAALYHKNGDIVQILLDYGASIEEKNIIGESPLNRAAQNVNVLMVKFLLERGANPNSIDSGYCTPLHVINRNRNSYEITKLLLDYGADPYAQDKRGETPFDYSKTCKNDIPFMQAIKEWQEAKRTHQAKIIYKISQNKLPQDIGFKFE